MPINFLEDRGILLRNIEIIEGGNDITDLILENSKSLTDLINEATNVSQFNEIVLLFYIVFLPPFLLGDIHLSKNALGGMSNFPLSGSDDKNLGERFARGEES